METTRILKIAFRIPGTYKSNEDILGFLYNKSYMYNRVALILTEYLISHSKKFDRVAFYLTNTATEVFPNGTLTGITGLLNHSKADIGTQPMGVYEKSVERVDFAYPFKLYHATFMTLKPKYKPHVFGIFQTFSLSLWIAILSVLMAMSVIYYVTWRRKYPFHKTWLHALAVLVRQSAMLRCSSVAENLLVYAWVIGAMFLCLTYDSGFLSFLTIPPVNQIKDLSQLTKAIKKGEINCISDPVYSVYKFLISTKQENLKVIGGDLMMNNLSYSPTILKDFIYERTEKNLALVIGSENADIWALGKKFISEDHFLETASALPIRKGFCCKDLIDIFVHKMLASGIYLKYYKDKKFLLQLPILLKYVEIDTSKRKLTLVDVAPAFMILFTGYFLSFLALIVEILTHHKKKAENLRKKRKHVCVTNM